MIVNSPKNMEETLESYKNQILDLKWIFSNKIKNVVDNLMEGNYTGLFDDNDTLSS